MLLLAGALATGGAPAPAARAASAAPARAASTAPADPDAPASARARSALVVFAALGERQLASVPGLSLGIMSAAQGRYSRAQLLLDLGQGARVASSAYRSSAPPPLALRAAGAGALVVGWSGARSRAEDAPQLLRPGLLASQVPGGAGYAGVRGQDDLDALLAADGAGRVRALSLGAAGTLPARIAALRARRRLVVADLPAGAAGLADLRGLDASRPAGELLVVIERAAAGPGRELLWSAAAGGSLAAGEQLSSQSTRERGLIASFDVAPTILAHLGLRVPADMRGRALETNGASGFGGLRALMARLHVIAGRRLKALGCLLSAWALLVLAAACWPRRRARGSARAWAMRCGALGVLWAPVAVLLPAALEPGAAVEYATIALACLALGALADALLGWPRALLAPAAGAIVALSVDALAGSELLMRSLLGPDPALGARFYGIGNELKSGLAVLVACAVAGALYPSRRGGRAAAAMAAAGALLAVVEGSARIGAGVGGVILVSFGFAVASVLLVPGALTRRRALAVLAAPVVGLVALAGIDLATAHGAGHFTGSVLHARSAGDLRDVIVRRYRAAWDELRNHAMPAAALLALAAGALAVRRRARLLAPVGGDPAFAAALAGGLAAGVVGALVEDSGPVLLVVAVFALGCVCVYLWGRARQPASGAPTGDSR